MSDFIELCDIWNPKSAYDYKVHFAKRNTEGLEPLNALTADFEASWRGWQDYKAGVNHWNRKYIFSLAHDYNRPNTFLFGGIWIVKERLEDRYEVELTRELRPCIKRLRIGIEHKDRQARCSLESYMPRMTVSEVLPTPYAARDFPGLDSLIIRFSELESIVGQGVSHWREPLSAVSGIYLLRDEGANANYVGAAYGVNGVWGRWSQYIETGHGGNAKTTLNFGSDPVGYARSNVWLTLLEPILPTHNRDDVITRERHWMDALGSRGLDHLNT
jgi:hypothetical protein